MFLSNIIDKIIDAKIQEFKEKTSDYLNEYKDEIFAKIKTDISNYITAHKDEILKLLEQKALEYTKEFIQQQQAEE